MNISINGAALALIRKTHGLTQHQLSIQAGLSNNAVFRMETKPYKVSYLRAKAIADVLGCSVADFSNYIEESGAASDMA